MPRALLLLAFVLTASPAGAQNTCDAKCNQQASECLKVCTGEPKDAQKPGDSQRLMECVKQCEAKTTACKAGCGGKK
jgi:hypothetical protein